MVEKREFRSNKIMVIKERNNVTLKGKDEDVLMPLEELEKKKIAS